MAKYNLLVKGLKGQEYIITDFIATQLGEKDCNILIKNNDFLTGFRFVNYKDTDFSWWVKVSKYLTKNKLYKGVYFDCDFNGNITRY